MANAMYDTKFVETSVRNPRNCVASGTTLTVWLGPRIANRIAPRMAPTIATMIASMMYAMMRFGTSA